VATRMFSGKSAVENRTVVERSGSVTWLICSRGPVLIQQYQPSFRDLRTAQADAELVDRGRICRFPRSKDSGFSLQRSDQNKLNGGFDTVGVLGGCGRSHFPTIGTMI
jgi:hypothetical protein